SCSGGMAGHPRVFLVVRPEFLTVWAWLGLCYRPLAVCRWFASRVEVGGLPNPRGKTRKTE
ncbi:MAG: hypothetical protein ACK56I_02805, partial [bacterium]